MFVTVFIFTVKKSSIWEHCDFYLKQKKVRDSIYKEGAPKYTLYVICKEIDWTVKEKHFE